MQKSVDKLPPVYDLYHSGHLVENTNIILDEECQNELRSIIERINCDEDISEALSQLILKFEGKKIKKKKNKYK